MASITVDVSEVMRKLDPKKMDKALEVALSGAADLVRAEIKRYPAPPAGSTYIRTGTLGGSWTKRVNGLKAIIGSNIAYAPYVQGADRQAWMHKGRWQTTADVARSQAPYVKRFIERALLRWAR
jgi:phage gpG-like protein